VDVREPIELSFGMVSGVDLGIDVLNGVHVPLGEGPVSGIFRHCAPISLNRHNDVRREMYSTRV